MALAMIAATSPPDPPGNPNVYEAEEGVLHHVGLEAIHGGYSGWGYVAGWSGDGQWVDFLVHAPSAGAYTLIFRYAASAAASREVYVNGAVVAANRAFPATGSYATYASVSVPLELTAGSNTVSLIYSAKLGSTGYVNLDSLTVGP
jgi:hypothetical protein